MHQQYLEKYVAKDGLDEHTRAVDIILGSLGFGEEAELISVERTPEGYRGVGSWSDGEEFEFESDIDLDDLHEWALTVLLEDSGRKIA